MRMQYVYMQVKIYHVLVDNKNEQLMSDEEFNTTTYERVNQYLKMYDANEDEAILPPKVECLERLLRYILFNCLG